MLMLMLVQALSQDKYLLTRQLERLEDEQQQEVAENGKKYQYDIDVDIDWG